MNRSKVKNKEGRLHAFLREIWPEDGGRLTRSWGLINGVVGSVPWASIVAVIPRQFLLDLVVDLASISLQNGHDWAMIGPRSCHDRELDAQAIAFRIRGKACGFDFVA